MIVAANYVGDLHQRVVDDDHVVVDRHAVRTEDDGIADDFIGKLDISVNDIVKADGMLGNPQPDGAGFAGHAAALGFFGVHHAALARIDWLAPFCQGFFAFSFQIFLSAETQIRFTFVQQALGLFAIEIEPVGLAIGKVWAADVGTFVPINPQPLQIGDQLIFEASFAAFDIGILDAQDHGAALLPGE